MIIIKNNKVIDLLENLCPYTPRYKMEKNILKKVYGMDWDDSRNLKCNQCIFTCSFGLKGPALKGEQKELNDDNNTFKDYKHINNICIYLRGETEELKNELYKKLEKVGGYSEERLKAAIYKNTRYPIIIKPKEKEIFETWTFIMGHRCQTVCAHDICLAEAIKYFDKLFIEMDNDFYYNLLEQKEIEACCQENEQHQK